MSTSYQLLEDIVDYVEQEFDVMVDDVSSKGPRNEHDVEGDVIDWVFMALDDLIDYNMLTYLDDSVLDTPLPLKYLRAEEPEYNSLKDLVRQALVYRVSGGLYKKIYEWVPRVADQVLA